MLLNIYETIDPDDEMVTFTWPDELEMSAERMVSNRRGKRTHRKYEECRNGRKRKGGTTLSDNDLFYVRIVFGIYSRLSVNRTVSGPA
ncbi:hypothetical protein DPMN_023040 [Dreissena polymorpha]|uniref:Uncharacterized protein n=1 Tax=Dreissena polymorpha TaxID=45954 RepID=A0A9D4LLL5_DREPO|nr:hypothetical protein DPMN_023040 [Dreissena polymorpha]